MKKLWWLQMKNLLLTQREELEKLNYVKKADPKIDYWTDFSYKLIKEKLNYFDDCFNLIIIGDENIERDFYIIPFKYISDIFVEKFLSTDIKTRRIRWVCKIKNHKLILNKCSKNKDVAEFYGNTNLLIDVKNASYEEITSKAFTNIRKKQYLFRKEVLENFNNECCLTRIKENDLIIASHIIPYSDRVDTRLDPSNGLCLSALYDKLFDKGFISFDDDYKVLIPSNLDNMSSELINILLHIKGKQILYPKKYPIKQEYLEYHRNHIFKG
jgi:putative restriction endonuclease